MDPFAVISPHFDDAVLSCGQFMAGRSDCTIVTVFAAEPAHAAMSTDYDRRSGFADAHKAVRSRQAEDTEAAHLLHATTDRLPFHDDQYRVVGESVSVHDIAECIVDTLDAIGARGLAGPLGLLHEDHLLTSEAVLQLVGEYDVWLYEELPGRVLWPDLAAQRLGNVGERFKVEHEFIGTGPVALKGRAVNEYRSQLWALDRRCLFVPERFHRVEAFR